MPNYEEENQTVDVPLAAGVAAYVRILQRLFALPRVQEVIIKPGSVAYRRFRRADEPEQPLDVDLTSLMPYAVVRSHPVEELNVSGTAAEVVAQLFARASMDGYNPVAFVSGTNTKFRRWHAETTRVILPAEDVYGQPLLLDPQIPDEALILCVSYGRNAALVDTLRSYKVTIPMWKDTTS